MKSQSLQRVTRQAASCWAVLLVCLLALETVEVAAKPAETGFTPLLEGDGQKHWVAYGKQHWPDGWVLSEGVLHRKAKGGDIMSTQHYANFDFRFEFKISPGGNSGIMYRVADNEKNAFETGPEYQIMNSKTAPQKELEEKNKLTSTASLYGLYARTAGAPKPAGEWNSGRILLRGNHVEHWLNGKKVVECKIGSDDWNQRVANSKFADWKKFAKQPSGHIVLQDHGDLVWYRNLRIRTLGKSK